MGTFRSIRMEKLVKVVQPLCGRDARAPRGAFLRPAVRIMVKNGEGGRSFAELGRRSALPSRLPARPLALRAAKGR